VWFQKISKPPSWREWEIPGDLQAQEIPEVREGWTIKVRTLPLTDLK